MRRPRALSAHLRPQLVGLGRTPHRNVNTVRHMADRYLRFRPAGKIVVKDFPAHQPMQPAHTVDCSAAPHRQQCHVERFRVVLWVVTAEGEQCVDWNVQNVGRIVPEKSVHELWRESVESCLHRGVGSKEIPSAGCRKRNVKRHALALHEVPRSFEYGERSVTFIEMANLRLLSKHA